MTVVGETPQPRDVQLTIGTAIGHANADTVRVRGKDVIDELMGHVSYTEMLLFTITGRTPTQSEVGIVDAVLVSLVDHGLQPSALAARMTYYVAPDAVQGAIAAGVLGAGTVLLGSMEQCSRLLHACASRVADGASAVETMDELLGDVVNAGRRIPGVGHGLHRQGDPRARRLLEIADDAGCDKKYLRLLDLLVARAELVTGHALPVNVTGAAGALLLGVGIPWEFQRGIAIVSRVAGLIAHLMEEQVNPITPAVRGALREASWMEGEA